MAEHDAGNVDAGQAGEAGAAAAGASPEEQPGSKEQPVAEAPPPEAAAAKPVDKEKPKLPRATATVTEAGQCLRQLKVEVCAARVAAEVDQNYGELRKTIIIKGFRPGHAPRHVLERRFAEQVAETAKEALVKEAMEQVLEDHKLRPAVPPKIDLKEVAFDPKEPLRFEVSLEIVPDFTVEGYKGIEVERPAVAVTDQDVDRAIEAARYRAAEARVVEDGVVEERDIPVCHAIAVLDGQEVWRQSELAVSLANETIGGLPVPGLRDAMLGASPGQTKSFPVHLPDGFTAEELRGKDVTLEITLDEVRRIVLPEVTDEWAKSLGCDDVEDLRDELRDELRAAREGEADEAVHERIADRLLELARIEVPQSLVEHLVTEAIERQRAALMSRGVPPEEIEEQLAAVQGQAREAGERRCKLIFVYEQIAEREKIFVTEDEVKQRIQAIAMNYRRRPAEVEAELEREGRLAALRHQMREEKVRDFLVQNARITQAAAPDAEPAAQES